MLAQIFTLLLLLFSQATRESGKWCAMTLDFSRNIMQRRKPRSTKHMMRPLLHRGNTSCGLTESVYSLLYEVAITPLWRWCWRLWPFHYRRGNCNNAFTCVLIFIELALGFGS